MIQFKNIFHSSESESSSLGRTAGKPLRLLVMVLPLLLGSCTILDNDLRDISDAPGFKEMVHEEKDGYTCDYQYQPGVTYVDDHLAPYITSISEDYSTLYLADYIPNKYLPEPGDLLASLVTDKLTYGMQHRVLSVTKEDGLYAVALERAALDDIFSHFVFDMNYDENEDPSEYNYDPDTEEDSTDGNGAYQAPARRAETEVDWDNWVPSLKKVDIDKNLFERLPPLKIDVSASGAANLDDVKKDVVKVTGTATLSIEIGVLPFLSPVLHIDTNKKEYNIGAIFGYYLQGGLSLKGKGNVDVDLVQWFRNTFDKEWKGIIKIQPGGVPLKITYEPVVKWENSIDASSAFGSQFTFGKFFGTGICWGMPGRENGPYWKAIETEKDSYFSLPTQCGFTSHFKVGVKINIALDTPPGPQMDVGVELTPNIGARFRTGASSKSKNPYYNVFHTGLPLEFGSKAYVKLFECLKYEFNITDFVKKCLGSTSNTDIIYEFLAKDWPFYPTVDNLSLTCQNQQSWMPPIFDLSFDLTKGFLASTLLVHTHPEIRIYKSEDIDIKKLDETPDPVFNKEPVAVKVFDNLKNQDVNSFKWTIDAVLERNKTYYAVLYYINDKPQENENRVIYSHAYPFTSQSPSIEMFGDDMTAQHYYYYKRNGGEHYYFDFKFRTDVQPYGDSGEIIEWGFQVGNKTFSIKKPISGGIKQILWFIKKSNKGTRNITFRPYAKFMVDDVEMTNWGTPYTVNLKYDPSLNEGEDQFYQQTTEKDKDGKTFKADWFVRGFDHESNYGPIDYDMSSETMRAPQVTVTPSEDETGQTADDEDDDFELEMIVRE